MEDFIKLILDCVIEKGATANGVEYVILPRDFHPMATQIPYFAIGIKEPKIIAISEDVPKEFRDVWVLHESECVGSDFKNCGSITAEEIKKVRILYTRKEFSTFLKMRLVMFQAVIDLQPTNEAVEHWKNSFEELEKIMMDMH